MLKKITAILLVLIFVFSFAACGKNETPDPEPTPSSSEAPTSSEESGDPVTLTDNDAKEIIDGILTKAQEIFFAYTCGGAPFDSEKRADWNENYFLSDSKDYNDVASLKAYTEKYFTKECAEREFYKTFINGEELNSRFIEKDGKLYVSCAGKGWPYEYDTATVKITEQSADAFSVTVTRKMFDAVDGTSVLKLKKEGGSWKFDNSFVEANNAQQ